MRTYKPKLYWLTLVSLMLFCAMLNVALVKLAIEVFWQSTPRQIAATVSMISYTASTGAAFWASWVVAGAFTRLWLPEEHA